MLTTNYQYKIFCVPQSVKQQASAGFKGAGFAENWHYFLAQITSATCHSLNASSELWIRFTQNYHVFHEGCDMSAEYFVMNFSYPTTDYCL